MATPYLVNWQAAALSLREEEIQNPAMLKGILKLVYQHIPWTDKPQEIYAWELVLEDAISELERNGEIIRRTGFAYGRRWLIRRALQKVCEYADIKRNIGSRIYSMLHGFHREM